ncbi:MAG: hypothetical protein RIA65_00230, partial [Woeseia sp.]
MWITTRTLGPFVFVAIFLSTTGCESIGAGNIVNDQSIVLGADPNASKAFPCLTSVYATALNCALSSTSEFSEHLAKTGDYDKGSAYLLLLSGTASAVATGFDFDEDVLKSAAVLAGTVIGARTIADPDTRRVVLAKGIKEMKCAVLVAQAAHSGNNERTPTQKAEVTKWGSARSEE